MKENIKIIIKIILGSAYCLLMVTAFIFTVNYIINSYDKKAAVEPAKITFSDKIERVPNTCCLEVIKVFKDGCALVEDTVHTKDSLDIREMQYVLLEHKGYPYYDGQLIPVPGNKKTVITGVYRYKIANYENEYSSLPIIKFI